MSTLRDMVSRVRSTHRLLSADGQLNDRSIAAELKSVALLLVKRDTDKRKLWNTNSLFHTIPCLEMESVPLSSCCDYQGETMVARSKHKLPKIAEGNYQYLVQGIYNTEGMKRLDLVTLPRYINILKLGLKTQRTYAWLGEDSYLYASSEFISSLKLVAFFEGDIPHAILHPDCQCKHLSVLDAGCTNPLDLEFKCPGYLQDNVITMTSERLLRTYFRINEDRSSDQKDEQGGGQS
jgi:hypothetical protein